MSEKILTEEEEKTITEDNKYLNKRYDISEILAFGNIPEFENDADRVICARQVGLFVRDNGLGNHDNLIKFLKFIPAEHMIILLKQLDLKTIETIMRNPKYKSIIHTIMKVVV